MTALGLHQLVPRSLLAGRWLVGPSCCLDDSGKDPQSRVTNLGGYIAREENWATFEASVERWFDEFNVSILQAKDLEETGGDFCLVASPATDLSDDLFYIMN